MHAIRRGLQEDDAVVGKKEMSNMWPFSTKPYPSDLVLPLSLLQKSRKNPLHRTGTDMEKLGLPGEGPQHHHHHHHPEEIPEQNAGRMAG
jgi:hypothetical protein